MKRLTLLAVALTLVLGMAVTASAAPEVAISGNLLVNAVWADGWDMDDDAQDGENFNVYERADLYFTVTANENLKGVLGLRSQRAEWGEGPAALGTPGGANSATLGIRDAYIDFMWPGTAVNVKAGIYTVGLPAAVGGGSYVLSDRAGAVMVSTALTDNVSALVGYTRLFNYNDDSGLAVTNGEAFLDGYLLAMPLSFEGVSATPYFLYGNMGKSGLAGFAQNNAIYGEDASAYWLGSDLTVSLLDPFILKADLIYSNGSSDDDNLKSSGWLFDFGVDYTGLDFATVSGYFIWTSGEDDDNDESESLIILSDDFAVGSFYFGGGSITGDDMGTAPTGFWALGASLTGIQSFAEGLTHDVHVLYVKGNNDEDLAGLAQGTQLTEDESLWELDFNTAYAIYDELTMYTQLGYISADWDDSYRGTDGGDAWKFATGVVYQF